MKIIISRADGGISVMALLGDAAEAAELASDHIDTIVQAELAQWPEADRKSVTSWRIGSDDDLPEDRTFRAAWRDGGKSVSVDMDHCREIWKDHMRHARAPKLAALDVEAVCAMEIGSDLKQIAAAKQTLRDVTKDPAITSAMTPDDLKKVWPAELQ